MKDYEMVVGLEVHAELNTKSKIYCNCRNAFGLEVNSQVCPVCMGMPGTLPTLNEKVVEYAIKMGHAMHCQINGVCKHFVMYMIIVIQGWLPMFQKPI